MSENNIETVKKFYDILMNGDPNNLHQVMDSDVQLNMMKGWPYGGDYNGLNTAIQDFFSKVWTLLNPFTLEVHEYIDAGDKVLSIGTYHTPHKKTGMDMPCEFAHIWSVKAGKLTRLQQFADTVQISRALSHNVPEK